MTSLPLATSAPVGAALASGAPLVALESSVLAQGLPIPENAAAHEAMVQAVLAAGAVPAVTAVVRGRLTLGLEGEALARFLARDGIRKASARDLAAAVAQQADAATTVAAAMWVAHRAGIRVLATGGIGGVHRGAPFDESGDLVELARTPVVVVCSGAKVILDLPATLERLETLGVPVVGYGTDELPGFFTRGTGLRLPTRVDDADGLVALVQAHHALGRGTGLLVVQPPPPGSALPRDQVDGAVSAALRLADVRQITGAALTPMLLDAVAAATGGLSLRANLDLLAANASLAARLAVRLSALRDH